MRRLRFLAIALLVIVVAGAACAGVIYFNRDRILRSVLATVDARTGFAIESSSSAIELRVHLVVVLRDVRTIAAGREVARAARVEAHLSYHAILFDGGIPLEVLVLERPQVNIAQGQPVAVAAGLPRFDPALSKALAGALRTLSLITRKLQIIDGSMADDRGALIVSHFNLKGYTRRHLHRSPWWVDFGFTREASPGAGSQWSGSARLGKMPGEMAPGLVPNLADARLWTWDLRLEGLQIAHLSPGGTMQSELKITLGSDGRAGGAISFTARALALHNQATLALGDYSFHAGLALSAQRFELKDIALGQVQGPPMLTGQCRLEGPYGPDPQISVALDGLQADVAPLKRFIKSGVVALPAWTLALADRVSAGRILIASLTLDSSLAELLKSPGPCLRTRGSIDATVDRAAISIAPETRLLPLHDIAAKVSYRRGVLTIGQGQMRAGNSRLSDFSIDADLAKDVLNAPYNLNARGDADLGELYPAIAQAAARLGADPARWVESIGGIAGFKLRAAGRLEGANRSPLPRDYSGEIVPNNAVVTFKTPAVAVAVSSGRVTIGPDLVQFSRVGLALNPGTAILSGAISLGGRELAMRDLALELRGIPAEKWLPMVVPPDQAGARGLVNGTVAGSVDLARPSSYSVNGVLTIGPGEIQFGFLRSPIAVRLATLTVKGHGAVLDMPASMLEGQGLDMKVGILDLQNPALRIDTVAQRLDLEALKFVRLPWSPKTPGGSLPGSRATGHVEVRAGNFAALPFTNLKTDFDRNGGDWRIYNLDADSLEGRIDLEISGREKDDWIRIKGRMAGMDAGTLMMVAGQKYPVLLGKIFGSFDLWADTGSDFFSTLAGKLSVVVKDGRVERFTLLSRILGLIDLKNWLSAQVPDPRKTGLPFRLLNAPFAGQGGKLYTEDLLLDGPVMDIMGAGSVDVGDSSVAMEVGVLPFQTVNWLLEKIPLIGGGLSKTSILAGYFHVHGKLSDPTVTVMPITSATELIKKTLGFPINLIRPNTVR